VAEEMTFVFVGRLADVFCGFSTSYPLGVSQKTTETRTLPLVIASLLHNSVLLAEFGKAYARTGSVHG